MKRPSVTSILSCLFLSYVSYSLYSIFKLTDNVDCNPGEKCLEYYLKRKPQFQLSIFMSVNLMPKMHEETFLGRISNFDYDVPMEKKIKIVFPEKTKSNGTLYLHLFLLNRNTKPTTINQAASEKFYIYNRVELVRHLVPSSAYKLLKGDEKGIQSKPISHIMKDAEFHILTGIEKFPENRIPVELYNLVRIAQDRSILPIMYYDFFNERIDKFQVLNEVGDSTEILLKYSPIGLNKLRLLVHVEVAFRSFKTYGFTDKDVDQLKGLFSSANIYLIGITLFVSSVHLLFDFLAIKNDVNFWQTRNTLAGLSLRTIVWRAVSQSIIFLYLMEEKASLIILIPSGAGLLIEYWKVNRVMPIDWKKLKFKEVKLTKDEKLTREIDAKGMEYLSYILYPLCIGGAIYSLLFFEHKSWYSWVIESLVHGVYGFGFLLMLPQLFINYKLKSVAHLPWRVFMYKAFNTFIDDLFAFIIDMPISHRIACFRDDIVFLIYLYQRWLYPVDMTRIESATHED